MDFSFNANTFRDMFHNTVAEHTEDSEQDERDVNRHRTCWLRWIRR